MAPRNVQGEVDKGCDSDPGPAALRMIIAIRLMMMERRS